MFELLVILIKKRQYNLFRILKKQTFLSHSRVSPQGPGSRPRVSASLFRYAVKRMLLFLQEKNSMVDVWQGFKQCASENICVVCAWYCQNLWIISESNCLGTLYKYTMLKAESRTFVFLGDFQNFLVFSTVFGFDVSVTYSNYLFIHLLVYLFLIYLCQLKIVLALNDPVRLYRNGTSWRIFFKVDIRKPEQCK